MEQGSWIRRMFEEGSKLKQQYGEENVFDLTLGNPVMEPPDEFHQELKRLAENPLPGMHRYMENAGYAETRKAVAEQLSLDSGISFSADNIIMTCGAAGAINVVLKTLLNKEDEVIIFAPYFAEFINYVENHDGKAVVLPTDEQFVPRLDILEPAIGDRTRAVLINSPNNPTGQIYSEESLKDLGDLLTEKGRKFNRTIYLVSDEPYRKIVFDGVKVPSIFASYNESIIGTSYSKDISIPGERIGFVAVNPQATYREALLNGMALTNRILGYVNAPALMQRVVACLQGMSVEISEYKRKRDILCDGLAECGYEFIKPAGTFYLFPRSPIEDDVKFVRALQEELILVVPGSGFNGPGHFRIAFCVDDATIINSMPGFEKVMRQYR